MVCWKVFPCSAERLICRSYVTTSKISSFPRPKERRDIKMEAIERQNPEWGDLYYALLGDMERFEQSKEKLVMSS